MLRIHLTDAQRSELQTLRRTDLPAARGRLEMGLMSAAGWSAPKIAGHLGRHSHTVRSALKGFAARGTEAFYPDAPGPEPDHDCRAEVTRRLSEPLGHDRTGTSRQLADALGPDIGIGRRQTHRYLGLLRAGYRRTRLDFAHVVRELVEQCPSEEKVVVVMDSLNTHPLGARTRRSPRRGRGAWSSGRRSTTRPGTAVG